MSDFVLNKLERMERDIEELKKHVHDPGYHEHLLEHDEFLHHHGKAHAKQESRKGERRGEERRKTTEGYTGEERRK